jgi:hypothetical protein
VRYAAVSVVIAPVLNSSYSIRSNIDVLPDADGPDRTHLPFYI